MMMYKGPIGFLLRIRDITVNTPRAFIVLAILVAIRGASLPLACYSRSMASSLVDFVFEAKAIAS